MSIIVEETPVEIYEVGGKIVYVKREDLASKPPAPRLAKLRGVRERLKAIRLEGYTKVGVLDTRISKSGWGTAVLANEIGDLEVTNYYPDLVAYKGEPPENQLKVLEAGHKIKGLKGGRTGILYARAKKEVTAGSGYMMPMGLVLVESVREASRQAQRVKLSCLMGDIVICVGSGMMAAGVYLGTSGRLAGKIYGISAGMNTNRQAKRIGEVLGRHPYHQGIKLILPEGVGYYDAVDTSDIPFPTSPYYDAKAWDWLVKNIWQLKEPILFWNIGT